MTVNLPTLLGRTAAVTVAADGVATVDAVLPGAGPVRRGSVVLGIVTADAVLPPPAGDAAPDFALERYRGLLAARLGLKLAWNRGRGPLDTPSVAVPVAEAGTITVGRYGSELMALGLGRGDNCVGRLDAAGRLIPRSGNPPLWGLADRLVRFGLLEAAS